MSENVTTEPDGASNSELAELTDFELDRKIGEQNQMINRALAARDDALKAVTKCEKSAVISAWRLGQFLIEKKRRLGHGQWLPWLSTVGLGERQARRYLRLAEIGLESDLDVSIVRTLKKLDAVTPATAPAPASAKLAPVEPEADNAAVIEQLESELSDARERCSIMLEAADPKSRKPIDTINNQRELIKTLKALAADWQGKASSARKENGALKRKIAGLEKQIQAMQ